MTAGAWIGLAALAKWAAARKAGHPSHVTGDTDSQAGEHHRKQNSPFSELPRRGLIKVAFEVARFGAAPSLGVPLAQPKDYAGAVAGAL